MIHPMEVTCGRKITGGISRATASTEKLLLSNYEKFKHTGDMGKDTEKNIYTIVAWWLSSIPAQCSIIILIGLLKDITMFVIVGWRQMKTLQKTARFGVSNSQTLQNTETATERCSTEISVWQKSLLNRFLCWTEKKVCSVLTNSKEVVRKLSFCKSYHVLDSRWIW